MAPLPGASAWRIFLTELCSRKYFGSYDVKIEVTSSEKRAKARSTRATVGPS